MADGSAAQPVVRRRLLVDSARLLSRAVPPSAWADLREFTQGDSPLQRAVRGQLDGLHWAPQHYPLLFTGYALIGLSILGFMYTCRALALNQYHMPLPIADLLGAAFGIALLGGQDTTFPGYTYDLPNAFIFALAILALVGRKWWWFFPLAALADYSKETALLLVIGYGLLWWNPRSAGFWMGGVLAAATFAAIRYWLSITYVSTASCFTAMVGPSANLAALQRWVVYHMWFDALVLVILLRIIRMRARIPWQLRRLAVFLPILLAGAFFQGILTERRQYLETLPIIGLILVQWAFEELGPAGWLEARGSRPAAGEPG